ncbi:MAG: IS200/IS605 family transposase [Sedimentisphaerales bacterium]|nr:IS200/IS605 family transposase [Sedimentisphaerales bacterium]
MSHTFSKLFFHCVFSTKGRCPLLKGDISDKINAYMAGIAGNHNAHLIRAGGIADHRHLLLELKPATNVSDIIRIIKANSSKWLRETVPDMAVFGWQTGYSAFTVSASAREKVVSYIDGQEEHHRKLTFEQELIILLERHGIAHDISHFKD